MPKITLFNGGLRLAQEPHLIQENESVVYLNTEHISGILRPIQDKEQAISDAEKWGHFFTSASAWYFSATPKDWVEFQERLYIGNRTGVSTKIVGGVEYNMGIQKPEDVPTLTVSEETIEQHEITRLDLVAGTDAMADIPGGVRLRYKVVNIDAAGKVYPSNVEFPIRIDEGSDTNQVVITCEDTNIDDTVAIFRFFDNYWRKIFEGSPGSPTVTDATYDISANADDTNYQVQGLKGTYQYALTFFNSADGTESAPVLSAEAEVDWGYVTVGNLEVATDPQVDERKLYRIGGASTAFTLVTTLNNVVTSYKDEFEDDELEGSLMTSEQNFPPVENMHFMMESYAMLFAAVKDKLVFTPIGEPDYWPQTYYLDFPRPITGLAKTPIGILVFNQYETWLVTGTGPLSLAQQLLTGSQGCVNGDSVVNLEGSALWASTDGVCMSNGGMVGVITDNKLDKIDLSGSVNAVVYDEEYFLLLEEQGEALILDLSRQIIRKANHGIDSFIVANDTLYGYDTGYLHELRASEDPLEFVYKSPKYIGRGYTTPKVYKNFYIFSSGLVTIKIYVDDVLAQTATHTQVGNHQVKIPTQFTRGHTLQFEISGTGLVYEVQWEDGNARE